MIFRENTESYLRALATRVDSMDRIAVNLLADEIATVERDIANAAASAADPVVMTDILDQLKTARIVDGSGTMMEVSDHIIESVIAEVKRLRCALQIIASEGDHMARWAIVDYASAALSSNRPAISLLPVPLGLKVRAELSSAHKDGVRD